MLAAILDPSHGHAGAHRGQPDQRKIGKDAGLDPEAAPYIGRHDEAQAVLRQSQRARDQRVQDERPHEVGRDREHAGTRIVRGDHAVGFDRRRRIFWIAKALADDDVGAGERGLDVAVDDLAMARLVGAHVLVQNRRAGPERVLGVDHRRQRLVLDLD